MISNIYVYTYIKVWLVNKDVWANNYEFRLFIISVGVGRNIFLMLYVWYLALGFYN